MSHQSGGGDRYRRIKQLRKRLDKTGAYWKHDKPEGADGTWVSNDEEAPFRDPKPSRHIDKPDPELRYSWAFGAPEGKLFGGKRPSKRKSVK